MFLDNASLKSPDKKILSIILFRNQFIKLYKYLYIKNSYKMKINIFYMRSYLLLII